MPIRFIIRPPHILTTPKLLRDALGARRTMRWPGSTRKPSILKDFFLTYPPIAETEEYAILQNNSSDAARVRPRSETRNQRVHSELEQGRIHFYTTARTFASASKPEQRRILDSLGFPVPRTATIRNTSGTQSSNGTRETGDIQSLRTTERNLSSRFLLGLERTESDVEHQPETVWFGSTSGGNLRTDIRESRYIVRPLRHSGGRGYRITSSPTDFEEGREYIQEVYPKNHEYRIIVVRGKPLFTLYKRHPNLAQDQPWNHANGSSFVTVDNPDNNRLRHTDIYERISNASGLLNNLDLVGIDVMYAKRGEYVVTEFNLCPAITLEHNIQKVKEHVDSDSFLSR